MPAAQPERGLTANHRFSQVEYPTGFPFRARNAAAVDDSNIGGDPDHRLNAVTQLMANLAALFMTQRQPALFQLNAHRQRIQMTAAIDL